MRIGLALTALALALAAPSLALADPAVIASVCGRLPSVQANQCQAAAGGRWVNRDAGRVCAGLIPVQVVTCMGVVAGKDYEPAEANNCARYAGGQVISCLGQGGRPHGTPAPTYQAPPPPPTYQPVPPQPVPEPVPQPQYDSSPLTQVCGRLIGYQVGQCQGAAGGRYIDGDAARACGNLIGTQVINCVSAIAGKDYHPGEAMNCGRLIGTQVISCLSQSGRPHVEQAAGYPQPRDDRGRDRDDYPPRREPLTVAEIRAEVAAALESLRASDGQGTERRLRRLLRDLR